MFPGNTPQHQFLRSLADAMLGRPEGVAGDHTPYSVDYGAVNSDAGEKGSAARAYKAATNQLPSVLVHRYSGHFVKMAHRRIGNILAFTPQALSYLLGQTNEPPGGTGFGSQGQVAVLVMWLLPSDNF
jgi:hypothetical protein